MMLYTVVLWVHSYLRWAIIACALGLIALTAAGWGGGRTFTARHERLHRVLVGLVDSQFLLGLVLFVWLSPISRAFFAAPKLGMKDSALRFFGMEHALGMLVAVAVLHITRSRSRKAPTDGLRHRRACLGALGFVLLAAVSIPWPGSAHGRPLFRTTHGPVEQPARAAELACPATYRARCASCHGDNGRGDGPAGQYLKPPARDFADPAFQSKASDAQISAVIREGGVAHGLSATMPSHADLSDADLAELTACVRSFRKTP